MNRYFVRLSYLGTNYCGWQIQPNAITVQSSLIQAFSTILKEPIDITGCGRTDTGVHARNFIAHFDSEHLLGKEDAFQLCYKLNRFLPNDISIHEIVQVNPNSHARFDALSRTYQYFINTKKSPFQLQTSWYKYGILDIEAMNLAAQQMMKYHDFSCFSKSHTQTLTNNCKISEAIWTTDDNESLVFTITADRFLRNMVRAIVGTLIEIGLGKTKWMEIETIILSKNRSEAGTSVPAHGLTLHEIKYPESIYTL